MRRIKILPTIVSRDGHHLEQLEEIIKLGLKEICLFPNYLELQERKNLYQLLEKSSVKTIPLVHLRNNMELWELEYFIKHYQTRFFNIHSPSRDQFKYPVLCDWKKYKHLIYIENGAMGTYKENEVKTYAGICIDFSHLEDARLIQPGDYRNNIGIIQKYPCGCAHIGAIKKLKGLDPGSTASVYSSHYFQEFSEFDYLKKYPRKYFPELIALELENSITEQLKAKEYIENLLRI